MSKQTGLQQFGFKRRNADETALKNRSDSDSVLRLDAGASTSKATRSSEREGEDEHESESDCAPEKISTPLLEYKKRKRVNAPNRKYNASYLAYGFTKTVLLEKGVDSVEQPLCIMCGVILSNDAMKPAKLKRHLITNHPDKQDKPIEFFLRECDNLKSQQKSIMETTNVSEAALRSSFLISLRISKAKKPFTIGEDLIKPSIIDVCTEMFGDSAVKKVKQIPLSANTVSRRITSMSVDIEEQLLDRIKSSKWFSIQLDESTDISNSAVLMVFVRYIYKSDMLEDVLFVTNLPERTTSSEVFRVLNEYFTKNGLDWKNNVGVCTDGAAAMTGRHAGVTARIKEVAGEDLHITHCIIHREMLASKQITPELHEVLNSCVKIINFIRANPLNCRLFEALCNELGADHSTLLLHTEVRWLSRGITLTRLYELREEVTVFLTQNNSSLVDLMNDNDWIAKLAYLADIFSHLNDLNLKLQGPLASPFKMATHIEAFKKKLAVWCTRVQNGVFDMFHSFADLKECDFGSDFNITDVSQIITQHLKKLCEKFDIYFPIDSDPRKGNMWIIDPFSHFGDQDNKLSVADKDHLIDISTDLSLKKTFSQKPLATFWAELRNEYPQLSEKAVKTLLPFPSTYMCEQAFSIMTTTKTKSRNRLDANATLRLSISNISPRINKLVGECQAQRSH